MVASKLDIVRKKESEGRAILQMKPIDREAYAVWSEAARAAVGELLGAESQLYKELLAARRAISVRFEVDPSYYLTQLGANLRRELAVLRKCIEEVEAAEGAARREEYLRATASDPAPSARARTAQSRSEAVRGRTGGVATAAAVAVETPPPTARAETRPAASERGALGVPSLLVYCEREEKCARAVLAALEAWGAKPVSGLEKLLSMREALRGGAGTCAVVVASGSSGGDAPAESSDRLRSAACAAGFLAALLGPRRVSVVFEGESPLLPEGFGILQVSIADPDGWRPKVLAAFRAGGADLK